jgi:hypothetical protein
MSDHSSFMDVILEASKRRYEQEAHYSQVREARWQELKELANESYLLLDGRRKQSKLHKQQALSA